MGCDRYDSCVEVISTGEREARRMTSSCLVNDSKK